MSVSKESKRHFHGTDHDTEFDTIACLKYIWGPDVYVTHPVSYNILNDFHMVLQKLKLPENATLLSFGMFSDVRLLQSSGVFSDITVARYTSRDRRIMTEFLKGEDVGFNSDHLCDYIGQTEGRTGQEVEKRTKESIKEVLACDLVQKDIFGVARLPQFDFAMTQFGFSASCKDIAQFNEAVMKVSSFVKPGGYILLIEALGQTHFTLCGKAFSTLALSRNDVDDALALAGFEAAEWYEHGIETECHSGTDYDATGYATLYAKKK